MHILYLISIVIISPVTTFKGSEEDLFKDDYRPSRGGAKTEKGGLHQKVERRALVERFNKAGYAYPPLRRIPDLKEGQHYPLSAVRKVNTKFGERFVASLRDTEEDELFNVFIPNRFSPLFELDEGEQAMLVAGRYCVQFTDVLGQYPRLEIRTYQRHNR